MRDSLKILQISTQDIGSGGAESIAWNLARSYREHGHTSNLIVGYKLSDDNNVYQIPKVKTDKNFLSDFKIRVESYFGVEDFNYPGSHKILDLLPEIPDIIHCHNLHGKYFDLRYLPELSTQVPVMLTLHDSWMLSGHCAHSFDCDRWKTGCGKCPDLTIYPPINKDSTRYNWNRKKKIYSKSRLYIATPSKWLMEQVESSMLAPSIIEAKVINNGIDLSVFKPTYKNTAKSILGIPPETSVLLFAANGIRNNIFKDYKTLISAVELVAEQTDGRQLLFIALGENAHEETIGNAVIRFVPYEKDPIKVAGYYQASDIYLHAARADTFPTTILEAMACGAPVVATAIGGIPEQVIDGITGFLTPAGDAETMANKIVAILENDELRKMMSYKSVEIAQKKYDVKNQVRKYLDWYEQIIKKDTTK